MKNDVKELDIETFYNYFLVGIKDFRTENVITFEIKNSLDQRKELYDYLNNYDGFLITFNGVDICALSLSN